MFTTTRLLAFAALAANLANATLKLTVPTQPAVDPGALDLSGTNTDSETIANTAAVVDQKSGASDDNLPPDHEPPPTSVTAVDGVVQNSQRRSVAGLVHRIPGRFTRSVSRRGLSDYHQVFAGTGTGPDDRDGSIQGTAYLTFSIVPNNTYNVEACLDFCSGIPQCVFVNLYYEYNNPGLDEGSSNLKCAAYADTHTAAEKTNTGGQQLAPPPAGLTYIQQSGGWAAKYIDDPDTPEGYELVFGPTNGANNAPGYMGFAFLDRYDVAACAAECNKRGADAQGGGCQYFNIWRAVVNGNPTTYTCSMYYVVSDASTATNTGQGDLKVTLSRGYRRISYVQDGGFEGYTCGAGSFCFAAESSAWVGTSPQGGNLDATIFHYQPYCHSGSSCVILGAATGADALAGTLTPRQPLNTVAGKKYSIQFFHTSSFSGPSLEVNAFVDIIWNGVTVAHITPGFEGWSYREYQVTAQGNDVLSFHGGAAPSWDFIDDVNVFLA